MSKYYEVPQFAEIEDTIIGPFTLKQFLVFVAGIGLVFFWWWLFNFGFFFWILSIPTLILSLGISLGSMAGRPALSFFFPIISYLRKPKRRIFRRDTTSPIVITEKEKDSASERKDINEKEGESKESRLRRLAYVLDQQQKQEEKLIKNENDQ